MSSYTFCEMCLRSTGSEAGSQAATDAKLSI